MASTIRLVVATRNKLAQLGWQQPRVCCRDGQPARQRRGGLSSDVVQEVSQSRVSFCVDRRLARDN